MSITGGLGNTFGAGPHPPRSWGGPNVRTASGTLPRNAELLDLSPLDYFPNRGPDLVPRPRVGR